MSILGIGIDTVDIDRFKKAFEEKGDKFFSKIFTKKEIEYAKTKKAMYMHMAGKFAAKEAVKKALPNGAKIGLVWSDIEILNGEDGKPYALLHGRAKEIMDEFNFSHVLVSITHTDKTAISNALVVKNG